MLSQLDLEPLFKIKVCGTPLSTILWKELEHPLEFEAMFSAEALCIDDDKNWQMHCQVKLILGVLNFIIGLLITMM